MIRKITLLLLLACFGLYNSGYSQAICGFDAIHQNKMANDPAYANAVQQNKTEWAQYMQALQNSIIVSTPNGNVYEIPVVVHIMHTGGVVGSIYNPTDATITNMIDYLNKTWAATWPAYPDTNSGGTYFPVRFKLAQRDPSCNATTGIVRYNLSGNATYVSTGVSSGTGGSGLNDVTLKNFDRWPPNEYYNIWVVDKIDGADGTSGTFIAGFAYFATSAGQPADGTIMLATQTGTGKITLPHEMGHAMGLYHTFEGATTTVCPANTNCNTQGDEVCDTEPMRQGSPGTCPTGTNPCTLVAWANAQKNIMNYSNCQDRFTPGQRTKALFNLLLYRSSLLSSLGSVAPGTNPVNASCTPTITNPGNTFDVGPVSVQLNDLNASSGGYNGDGNLVYVNKTCLQRANLTIGASYNLNVTTGANTENVRVYIDYNNNGVFDLPAELVYSHNGTTGNETHTFTYNVPVPTVQAITTCTPLRMRVISDFVSNTSITPCGALLYGQAEDYSVYYKAANTTGSVTIAANPSGTTCIGTPITFTATPSANVTTATYKWFVNSVQVATGNPYVTSTIANNSVVKAQMFYSTAASCVGITDSAFSNAITVQRTATGGTATVTISGPPMPVCPGQPITFTVTNTTNGGSAPIFDWKINGVVQQTGTSSSFTTSTFVNNDVVTAVMTSSLGCINPATSNSITITTGTVTPSATISLTSGTNPGCPGQSLTFTANPVNGGTTPAYQWKVNGTAQPGATANTFTTSTLGAGDIVSVTMTSSNPCASPSTANSNTITIIFNTVVPSVSIALTGGSTNPACKGAIINFLASPINGGTAPNYNWKINGSSTGTTTSNYSTTSLNNGDVVSCTMTSSNPCATPPIVTSNTIMMTIIPVDTPMVMISITKGSNPGCSDSLIEFTATAMQAGSNFTYSWTVNGITVASGNIFSSSTLITGDIVVAHINITGSGCRTTDNAASDPINIIRNVTPSIPIISFIGNMLVANNSPVQWYGPSGLIAGATNQNYHPTQAGSYYCVATNNGCNSGPSNSLLISLLSISTYNMDGVSIYPNPTNGDVTIDWGNKFTTSKIEVFNALGQSLIRDIAVNVNHKTLNLSSLANGNYFIVLRDEKGNAGTSRITVAR